MRIDFDSFTWLDVAGGLVLTVTFILGLEWYLKRRSKKGGKKWQTFE